MKKAHYKNRFSKLGRTMMYFTQREKITWIDVLLVTKSIIEDDGNVKEFTIKQTKRYFEN
jgi:hypothetical protein